MQLAFIFLSMYVVIMSCYQYQQPFIMGRPWINPFENDITLNYPYSKYPKATLYDVYKQMIEDDSSSRIKNQFLPAPETDARIKKLTFKKNNSKSSEKTVENKQSNLKKPPASTDKPSISNKPSTTESAVTKPSAATKSSVTEPPIIKLLPTKKIQYQKPSKKQQVIKKPIKKQQTKKPPNIKEKLTEEEQSERFFYQLGYNLLFNETAKASALMKTVTFTITSTCTALTFITCIPSSGLVSPIIICNAGRRRRNALMNEVVSPTDTMPVVATAQPRFADDSHNSNYANEIDSSMEDTSIDSEVRTRDNFQNQQRFIGGLGYSLWQAFATGYTTTSWSVTSTTVTQTINPPAGTPFPCLPSGITTCAAAVTIG